MNAITIRREYLKLRVDGMATLEAWNRAKLKVRVTSGRSTVVRGIVPLCSKCQDAWDAQGEDEIPRGCDEHHAATLAFRERNAKVIQQLHKALIRSEKWIKKNNLENM